jgi:pyruvate formate lyase activating enzyme
MFYEASYYNKLENNKVSCVLCPHNCVISDGKFGICQVRKNENGILYSLNFEKLSAVHIDSVEKKPLYHFYPGKSILSLGSVGCNLKCNFCQNSHISQINPEQEYQTDIYMSDFIISEAKRMRNNIGIAYTYNEPIVWYEYMFETAVKAKKNKLKNVVVSNGYINSEPLKELIPYIDAFNIDLKGFSEDFYNKQTGASLQPVLETIENIVTSEIHLEITYLIIPTLNDDLNTFRKMLKTLVRLSGRNTILHISRYFPSYKSEIPATPKKTMTEFYLAAKKHLNFVYMGNIQTDTGNNTNCPNCGSTLINRSLQFTSTSGLNLNKCNNCNHTIPGKFLSFTGKI